MLRDTHMIYTPLSREAFSLTNRIASVVDYCRGFTAGVSPAIVLGPLRGRIYYSFAARPSYVMGRSARYHRK